MSPNSESSKVDGQPEKADFEERIRRLRSEIDWSLLEANLRLTGEERLRRMFRFRDFCDKFRAAGAAARIASRGKD
jgi:hypothetical protein